MYLHFPQTAESPRFWVTDLAHSGAMGRGGGAPGPGRRGWGLAVGSPFGLGAWGHSAVSILRTVPATLGPRRMWRLGARP